MKRQKLAKECANLQQFQDLLKKWASCSFASRSSAALNAKIQLNGEKLFALELKFQVFCCANENVTNLC